MKKFDFTGLNEELREGFSELSRDYGWKTEGGIAVTAVSSPKLFARRAAGKIEIGSPDRNGYFRAFFLALTLREGESTEETRCFDQLGLMTDCSRNAVLNPEGLRLLIRKLAVMGYNRLLLYTEDTYEVEGEPYFGYMRGRYTREELRKIDRYASLFGIELLPCIQTLAHVNAICRWKVYEPIIDCNDILFVGEQRTKELIENMFRTLSETFTSRNVHIGMDEAQMLGAGKYRIKNGYRAASEIMMEHLSLVCEIAEKYGFRPMMWSDMFFRTVFGNDYYVQADAAVDPGKFEGIPKNLELVYWDYYSTDPARYDAMIAKHKLFRNPIGFAGGIWTWTGFAPQNAFGKKTADCGLSACIRNGIRDVILTAWGDDGGECPVFSALPVLASAAGKAYGSERTEAHFAEAFGMAMSEFEKLDYPNRVGEGEQDAVNPCKYMLFNDYLIGLMDSTISGDEGARYAAYEAELRKNERNRSWGILFKTQRALCGVLALKYDLGVLTREAYLRGDRAEMERLLQERYRPLVKRIKTFLECFERQWMRFNKPFGFEVQVFRIGGLLERTKYCIGVLERWLRGEITRIDELEQARLDVECNKTFERAPTYLTSFAKSVTANVFSW